MKILLLSILLLAPPATSFALEASGMHYLVGCANRNFHFDLEFDQHAPDWNRRDFSLVIARDGKSFATLKPGVDPASKIGYELIKLEKSGLVRGREISFEGKSVGPKAVGFHGKLTILDNDDADYSGRGDEVQAVLAFYTDEQENPISPPAHSFGLSCGAASNTIYKE